MDLLNEHYVKMQEHGQLPTTEAQARMWERWLWETAVNQALIDECGDMNMNQGIGIFLCVMLSYDPEVTSDSRSIKDLLPHSPLVHLTSCALSGLSQRKLLDQVECLQLSWGNVVGSHEHLHGRCETTLRLLMARLGFLSRHAYANGPLDYIQYTTVVPNNTGPVMYILTRKYIRRMCCIFVILFRTLHIITQAQIVPAVDSHTSTEIRASFQEHHLECSGDFFSVLQQMVQLAPAMRLVYRTDFSGMYNDVSQVVYYHYPQYHRQAQLPLDGIPDSAVHCLPLLTQLLPQVPVVYDDDDVIPGLTWHSIMASSPKYAWLVSCATVFLVQVDYERRRGLILASPDGGLVPLIAHYVAGTGTSLRAAASYGHSRRKVTLSNHSHVDVDVL